VGHGTGFESVAQDRVTDTQQLASKKVRTSYFLLVRCLSHRTTREAQSLLVMSLSYWEQLALFINHLREALAVLRHLQQTPDLKGLRSETHGLQLEELRASVSEQVMETLSEVELRNASRFWRKRRAMEASWKDSAGRKEAPRLSCLSEFTFLAPTAAATARGAPSLVRRARQTGTKKTLREMAIKLFIGRGDHLGRGPDNSPDNGELQCLLRMESFCLRTESRNALRGLLDWTKLPKAVYPRAGPRFCVAMRAAARPFWQWNFW
jgi:hypothetical protein